MRAQDKANVIKGINMGASPQEIAAKLNVPIDEVRAIFRKQNRPDAYSASGTCRG